MPYRNDSRIKVTAPGALRKFFLSFDLCSSGKISLLSALCSNLHKLVWIFRLLLGKLARHKQSKILKHCRTKCDNSVWVLTPLERMYPSLATYANFSLTPTLTSKKALDAFLISIHSFHNLLLYFRY